MKGILFKPDMIKAIVEGRKTQTRRVIKPQPEKLGDIYEDASLCYRREGAALIWQDGFAITKSRYQPSETVYIKEAVAIEEGYTDYFAFFEDTTSIFVHPPESFISKHFLDRMAKYTARTMPAWAARYFIKIKDVRAERLQEITEEDAIKEGCQLIARTIQPFELKPKPHFTAPERPFTHLDHFIGIWDSINKPPYDWNSNPYVWKYSFVKFDKLTLTAK